MQKSEGGSRPDPKRIRRITESIINLPTLPTVISKMIELVDNPKTSSASLSRLISTDQALTARILKLANSAYYGFPREISTVNQAIVVLGFNAVRETGLSLSVFDMFKNSGDNELFDITSFWEHSMGVGLAARMVAKRVAPAAAGEAFVAGLLHDIGKIVYRQYFQSEFEMLMHYVNSEDMELCLAEERVTGTNHAQVGEWLVEKWRLPRRIVESVACHHMPADAPKEPLFVAAVSLADHICHLSGIGQSGRKGVPEVADATWELLEQGGQPVGEEQLDAIQTEFLIEYDKSETFISFIHDEMG